MKNWQHLTGLSKKISLLIYIGLIIGCGQAETATTPVAARATAVPTTPVTIDNSQLTIVNSPTPTQTFTPTPTPTPTQTPSPTHTATPTPTPSPTALPLTLSGDPYTIRLRDPIPTGNAPCGLVDVLDFPIDPPDAAGVNRGGQDFGIYRERYLKIHAGEDWGGPGEWGSNFGTPVYSIGHGWVTYAEPEGWNRDKGVVIIRHILADGTTFLSFYGHLDPPSVVLQPGDCVQRGQQVGNIGRPRSSPHLHFEIRTHLPYTPGPGYWPENPTLVGWLPPSPTIWQQRIASSPGVQWAQPLTITTQPIGQLDETNFAIVADNQLLNISLENGRILPTSPITHEVSHALLSPDHSRLYTASRFGQITAYQLPDFAPLWQLELASSGTPTLIALPGGDLVISLRESLYGVSTDGRLRWQKDAAGRPFAWTTHNNQLILTTSGPNHATWLISPSRTPLRATTLTGYPLTVGSETWLYAENGLFRLNPSYVQPEPLYPLPTAYLLQSRAVPLPGGGLLLAHADRADQRLIAFNTDGSLRWQRSYKAISTADIQLLTLGDQAYLITVEGSAAMRTLRVYAIDLQTADLTHIFTGGTRQAHPNSTWATATHSGTLLINIGGGHLFHLNPTLALEQINTATE
ncbi:MAG: peptidoglycan DD-metalloendopeptidase family protein [Ardenticatenaceae bacterium]|nr:peptidoglycan DD-metalloendopeptidase family protein [Ardenticatenaceae bacterium]